MSGRAKLTLVASRSILVSGGGIAGLTAALTLARIGYRIELFEKAETISPIGAGIQLSSNAMRILDELGLADSIKLSAAAPVGIKVLSARNGKEIMTIPLGSSAIARYGLPYLTIHRADLHSVLLSACEADTDITLTTGVQISDAAVHSNGTSILAARQGEVETCRARMLVVADGVHSDLRNQTAQNETPLHSGFEAWRAMIPAESLPSWVNMDFTHLVMGTGAHAVLYPVSNRRYLNVVVCIKSRKPYAINNVPTDREYFKRQTKRWSKQLHGLFEVAETWSVWPILQRPKTMLWNGGPVAFVGDASHAMLPFAAQGAAMAIEDAAVLAKSVETHGANEDALKHFANARTQRLGKMRRLAKSNGELYHMGWPFSAVRNIGMKLLGPSRLLDRQSWVYDWRI